MSNGYFTAVFQQISVMLYNDICAGRYCVLWFGYVFGMSHALVHPLAVCLCRLKQVQEVNVR